MKLIIPAAIMALLYGVSLVSCSRQSNGPFNLQNGTDSSSYPGIFMGDFDYSFDSTKYEGFLAYDSTTNARRPAILILPEWWGLNDYPKKRAEQLASMGYVALALDLYGNRTVAETPDRARALTTPFYAEPYLAKRNIEAALKIIKSNPLVDSSKIAVIGYCFGGAMALNFSRIGEPVAAVVSFHGGLKNLIPVTKEIKAQVLVCNGEDDKGVSQDDINWFKRAMDSVGAKYIFKSYPNAVHGFTNPEATVMGEKFSLPIAYNAEADSTSWADMKSFFDTIFH